MTNTTIGRPQSEWYSRETSPEIERLRADAARYDYLRTRDLDTISNGGVFAGMTPQNVVLNGDDLDREVDAAMLKASQEPSA